MVRLHRHLDGADGANPEHGVIAHQKYGLLAPKEPADNSAAAETQGSGDSPEESLETGRTDWKETGIGERNRKRALLVCDQKENEDEEQGTPD